MGQGEDHALDDKALEALGEEKVRRELDAGRLYGPRAAVARDWLRQKEEARASTSPAELLAIARDAKTAALEASRSARNAAVEATAATGMIVNTRRTAVIAMVVGAIALILSLMALFPRV